MGIANRPDTPNNIPAIPRITNQGEDCLFLDLTVPAKAIRSPGEHKLPVMMWYYGGAYIVGSKEQRGNAEAMVKASGGNIIWVASNYRLGAYGFLNGKTVEKEGTPNAGLWDQHAALQWIQDHISKVGGDPKTVTAMGISAGAGSIVHHLVFEGGKRDPLFKRAIIQSPGYSNFQDRVVQLDSGYKKFEEAAGCAGKGLACLRKKTEAEIKDASQIANSGQRPGSFAFGPAPDGQLIRNTPTLEFAAGKFEDTQILYLGMRLKLSGNYFKGIEVVISSHVADEGTTFSDPAVDTDAKFDEMLERVYGNSSELAPFIERAKKQLYPALSAPGTPYKTERQRMGNYVTEGSFSCHNRIVVDAYPGKTYVVNYAIPPSSHGSDQAGTFFNPQAPQHAGKTAAQLETSMGYQSYIVSTIRSGNPNTYRSQKHSIEWPLASGLGDAMLGNVLKVESLAGHSGLKLQSDDQLVAKDRCEWWSGVQKAIEKVIPKAS
jgi:carboxylesterase type B